MKRNHSNRYGALGAAILALAIGGCAAAPSPASDPSAAQQANRKKQGELSEMEKMGQRDDSNPPPRQ